MVSKLVQILLFARIAVGQSLPHRFPQRVRSLYANLYGSNLVVDSTYAIGGSQSSGEYFQLSGTSMSAPMVVGSAASMIEQAGFLAPGLAISPDTIKGRLMKTATKLPLVNYQITIADTSTIYNLQHDIFTADAGSLDVLKALGNTDVFPRGQFALSPIVCHDTTTKRFRLGSATGTLGTNGVWGDNGVWRDGTSADSDAIWGSQAIWGDSAVIGESIAVAINGEH